MDASPIPVSMSNDSELASRWFWSLCYGKPDDTGRESRESRRFDRLPEFEIVTVSQDKEGFWNLPEFLQCLIKRMLSGIGVKALEQLRRRSSPSTGWWQQSAEYHPIDPQ